MTFITEAHGRGSALWMASIFRSTLQAPLLTQLHDDDEIRVPLWWGPIVSVRPGDEIVYFVTPWGFAVERVTPCSH